MHGGPATQAHYPDMLQVRHNVTKILALTSDLFGTDKVKDNAKLQEIMAALARSFYVDMRPEFEAAVGPFRDSPETGRNTDRIEEHSVPRAGALKAFLSTWSDMYLS